MRKSTDSLEMSKKSFGYGEEDLLKQYEEAEKKINQEENGGQIGKLSYDSLKEKIEKRGIKSYSEMNKNPKQP